MNVYLASFKTIEKQYTKPVDDIYLLSSFYEHKGGKYGDYVYQKKHILDSGAFSMLSGNKNIDFKKYTSKYCDFIIKTKQNIFIELDIYKLIGTEKTEQLRDYIEQRTGKQVMPVWHKHLGINYLNKLCENYKYIAFGGFVLGDIKKAEYKYIPKLLKIAKENNCKVHGLGFTSTYWLQRIKFYSVDSTTWLSGGRFGEICLFKNNYSKATRIKKAKNLKVKNTSKVNIYNFNEWVKFQKHAEKNL